MLEYKTRTQEGTLLAKYFGLFKRPKILRYNKTTLVSLSKPDVTRKGQEMAGIVKTVTKTLEPEDPFKILVVDHLATLSTKTVIWSKPYVRHFLKYVTV